MRILPFASGRRALSGISTQTLARFSPAALFFAGAFAANAANPGTLLVLDKSDNKVSLVDLDRHPRARRRERSICNSIDDRTASPGCVVTMSLLIVDVAAGTEGIAVSPDQREVWTNRGSNTVSIIDVASSKVVATLDSKSFAIRAKSTDYGEHVLVSNAQSGDGAVFDAASRREVRRIKMKSDASPPTLESKLSALQFGRKTYVFCTSHAGRCAGTLRVRS